VATLARAQARGQIRFGVDPEVVVDQLWGACYHRLLLSDQPLTSEFAQKLVDNPIHGLAIRADRQKSSAEGIRPAGHTDRAASMDHEFQD